jgi:hypothetical protein
MRSITRFRFSHPSNPALLEGDMSVAVLAVEALYGPPRLRIEAGYLVREDGATCVIDARGAAGDALTRIFAGLCVARVGEDGFTVEHVEITQPRREQLAGVA